MASVFAKRCVQASGRMQMQPVGIFGNRFGSRSLSSVAGMKVAIGDKVPNSRLDQGFPPVKVPLADYCKDKKIVLVGLPGAFTPT